MTLHYYDYAKLFSFNCTYNFLLGGRGLGKTFGAKVKATKDAVKTTEFAVEKTTVWQKNGNAVEQAVQTVREGDQFVYLRRYKPELRLARDTFFADFQHKFPNMDFRINGIEAQMSPAKFRNTKGRAWATIGYFIALVNAQSYKSVAFPKVKLIIFDEFIIEKGALHYLPDEAKVFNNFYSTVDRWKDKTRVLFLANSVAINNPYFIEYGIDPKQADENGFIRLFNGFMLCHFPDSKEFESDVYNTSFGQFIKGTEYADYAVGNNFADNADSLIKQKSSSAKYFYTLETLTGTFSIWYDMKLNEYYAQAKRPKDETIFTLVRDKMDDNKTLMTFSDKPLGDLRTSFRHARLWFDKPATRNAFLEVFKR